MTCTQFPWEKLFNISIYNTQFNNYLLARAKVGNNPFYGWKRDLTEVASTRYKDLGGVAVAILDRIGGNSSVRMYAGSTRYAYSRDVDRLIDSVEASDPTEEDVAVWRNTLHRFREVVNKDFQIVEQPDLVAYIKGN